MKCFYKISKAARRVAFVFMLSVFPVCASAGLNAGTLTGHTEKSQSMNKKKNVEKHSGGTFDRPDFAFPATVEKNAAPILKSALNDGNGPEVLKAAIQLVVARNLISGESAAANIAFLDSLSRVTVQPYSSLFLLLEATLYTQLYDSNRWQFDSRTLPDDSQPEDVMAWSGNLFAKKVLALVEESCAGLKSAADMPLSDIGGVVEIRGDKKKGFGDLTVADFMVLRSVDLLESFGSQYDSLVIPFRKTDEHEVKTAGEMCAEKSISLLDMQIASLAQTERYKTLVMFISLKSEKIPYSEKSGFIEMWKDRLYDTPVGGRMLDMYYTALDSGDFIGSSASRSLYSEMSRWLEKYPESEYSGLVRHDIALISQKKGRVEVPDLMFPEEKGKGKVWLENMNMAYVHLFRLPDKKRQWNSFNIEDFDSSLKSVAVVPVEFSGEIPFSGSVEVEIPALPSGSYVAFVSDSADPGSISRKKKSFEYSMLPVIVVTDIAIITSFNSDEKDSGKGYVVDAHTQKPLSGVKVGVGDGSDRNPYKWLTTDADGSFPITGDDRRIMAVKGDDRAYAWTYSYYHKRDRSEHLMSRIFTDLSIYHPGDTVRFVMAAWKEGKDDNRPAPQEKASVVLSDPNGNATDTLEVMTDRWGRASGEMRIPAEGLLGSFSLYAVFGSQPRQRTGYVSIDVAEYKSPTFFVGVEADSTHTYEAGDLLKFKGYVKTFSGMPLGGSEVSYKVTWVPWWRWWHGPSSNASYGGTTTVGENGEFMIELPTENLKGTQFERGIYSIEVTATSLSGETQEAPAFRFSLGQDMQVSPSLPDRICVDSDSLRFNVPVYDMLGLPKVADVDYSVRKEGEEKPFLKGVFKSPVLSMQASSLPSGKYIFEFNIDGDTLKTHTECVIFRKGEKKPPYATPLWIPDMQVVAPDGAKDVEVEFGSWYDDSYILCVVSGDKGTISSEWIHISGKNRKIKVPSPEGDKTIWVTFSGMHDFMQNVASVKVVNESSLKKLEVKAVSFRDRISAGSRENWKFLFSIKGEASAGIPAFAVMSDKALNALSPFAWSFNPSRMNTWLSLQISSLRPVFESMTGYFSVIPKYDRQYDYIPDWNTYGRGLGNLYGGVRVRGMMMTGAALPESVKVECADDCDDGVVYDGAVEQKSVMSNAVMSKMSASGTTADRAEAVEEEMEAPRSAGPHEEEPPLRQMEMPLAFFLPNLNADAEGCVEVAFDVPDYNTTWQFQLMGYDGEMLTAGLVLDAVASKPVMVRSNPPRYLRTGDRAEISALIFNNSDKVAEIGGRIELVDPASGKVLKIHEAEKLPVDPAGSRAISISYDVPSDINGMIVRAYAIGGQFSDGEQTMVPILPSSTPVVESTQFYLKRGAMEFNVTLPEYGDGSTVTLKYCDNPIWECILALPAISTPDSDNILSVVRSLFANTFAAGAVDKYPAVKSGLERLFNSADTMSLTSNLQKDASLKTVSLDCTPWVNDARSETERMRQLSGLLEGDRCADAVKTLVEKLASRQSGNGGWSWCPGMPESDYITREVILQFGKMKDAGYMPEGCDGMIKRAISYCDDKAYENYVKAKYNFSTIGMLRYLYARSFFDAGTGKSGFSKLRKAALSAIGKEWKEFDIYDKALASMLMSRTKGKESLARVILESLSQYASKDETKGWWFDNLSSGFDGMPKLLTTATVLQAFDEIEPGADAVEGIRQWLILQKETENWGANPYTVDVIESILGSGADWSQESMAPAVMIGGRPLALPEDSGLAGSYTVTLDANDVSGKKLTVVKHSAGPSWGGVINQYVAPIKDVKAEKSANLRIEKQLLVVRNTPAGEVVEKGEIKVGDKVRVTLTLKCDKDMDYVALIDERAACLEPAEQLSGYMVNDGLWAYREVRDTRTSFFIGFLPKGTNVISYDCYADREGEYALGIASVQCQYSPLQTAHSAGETVIVK